MTARERMLAGELYDASDPELTAARERARELLQRYSTERDAAVLGTLFDGSAREPWLRHPFTATTV